MPVLGYMLVELPAGLTLRYVHPRWIFSAALISFGVCAACLAAAKSYAAVMVLRVLIGLGEAFVNNAYLFLTLWYKPQELSVRTAAIYCMTPVAGAISGIIAYGTGKNLQGTAGISAWKWLFVIEGVVTIAWGLVAAAFLPALPENVTEKGSFLFPHERERQIIHTRFRQSQNTAGAKFRAHQISIGLKDPKMYLGAMMVGAQGIGIGAFSVFLPTFINAFGFGALETQLYSMIPYAFGLATLIGFSYLSDKIGKRAMPTLGCLSITTTGFVILLCTTNKVALLAGACFVAAGAYPGLVISVAWLLPMHGGYTKRATCMWIIQIFIQCYSIIATQVYRTPPRFFLGHGIAVGLYVLAAISTIALYFICRAANNKKHQRAADFAARDEVDPESEKDFEDLCDFHPRYFYTL